MNYYFANEETEVPEGDITWSPGKSVAQLQSEQLDPALHPLRKKRHYLGLGVRGRRAQPEPSRQGRGEPSRLLASASDEACASSPMRASPLRPGHQTSAAH